MDAAPRPADSSETAPAGAAVTTAPLLRRLFVTPVATAQLRGGTPPTPPAEEIASLGQPGEKRLREFAAGRACARHALAQIGRHPIAIPRRVDGRPQWPDNIVGSVSHCHGYAAAVVARRSRLRSLGLDIERVADVDAAFEADICTPSEREWIRGLPASRRLPALALLFSAKEALYKCQHPLTGRWIEFSEVSLRPHGERIAIETAPAELAGWQWSGRYLYSGGYVLTGFCARSPTASG